MLLDRARDAGCNVQRSRVMSVDTSRRPRYCVEGDWQEADFSGSRGRCSQSTAARDTGIAT